ncbi:MAG: hypothetical protein WC997_15855 [Porticoccaceae bacterium]
MTHIYAPNSSKEYTQTTADIQATRRGIYALDYVADSYGTASIDFLVGDTYYPAEEYTEQTHRIITIPPSTIFRVSITGGTGAVVRLTELDYHTA